MFGVISLSTESSTLTKSFSFAEVKDPESIAMVLGLYDP